MEETAAVAEQEDEEEDHRVKPQAEAEVPQRPRRPRHPGNWEDRHHTGAGVQETGSRHPEDG